MVCRENDTTKVGRARFLLSKEGIEKVLTVLYVPEEYEQAEVFPGF